MAFDSAVLTAFASGNVGERVFLIDFEFDSGTLYFTTIPNGKTYLGNNYIFMGSIGSVGTIAEGEELDPAEYELVIGSADPVTLATFLNQPAINRKVICREALINNDQSFVESGTDLGPWIYFQGSMQPPTINDSLTPTITINVTDELADWDRKITSLYTDAEQQRLFPGDNCLEHISNLAVSEIIWPTQAAQRANQ